MMINSFLFIFILLPLSYIFCDPIELSEIIIPEHTSIGHLLLTLNSSLTNQRYSYRFVINNHRPIFPYKSSIIELHISENSPPYQSKLFIQQAYDQDQIDNQKQLKYQLKNLEKNFPFRLETNVDVSNRLALVLTQSLDRE